MELMPDYIKNVGGEVSKAWMDFELDIKAAITKCSKTRMALSPLVRMSETSRKHLIASEAERFQGYAEICQTRMCQLLDDSNKMRWQMHLDPKRILEYKQEWDNPVVEFDLEMDQILEGCRSFFLANKVRLETEMEETCRQIRSDKAWDGIPDWGSLAIATMDLPTDSTPAQAGTSSKLQ